MPGPLVVIGSGPGIGSHVAARFAVHGFNSIALLARNPDQLAIDAAFVKGAVEAEITVKTYHADITDLPRLRGVLDAVTSDLGPPECVFYNAARIKPTELLKVGEDDILFDIKINVTSLHEVAKWAIPHLVHAAASSAKPSLLVTNSHLPATPEPPVFSLTLAKAAQRNLAQSLAQVYGPQGVHVGLVVVSGVVAPEKAKLNPSYIANQAWELYNQPKDMQSFEVEIKE